MLTVRITLSIPDGQHRVHVRGDRLWELVRVSGGLLQMYSECAVGPEENWRQLAALWHNADTPVAQEALVRLHKQARPAHLHEHPDCPYRNRDEGRPAPPHEAGRLT